MPEKVRPHIYAGYINMAIVCLHNVFNSGSIFAYLHKRLSVIKIVIEMHQLFIADFLFWLAING